MPSLSDSSARKDMLVIHYRAIGPAAIMAALLCAPRQREKRKAKTYN